MFVTSKLIKLNFNYNIKIDWKTVKSPVIIFVSNRNRNNSLIDLKFACPRVRIPAPSLFPDSKL